MGGPDVPFTKWILKVRGRGRERARGRFRECLHASAPIPATDQRLEGGPARRGPSRHFGTPTPQDQTTCPWNRSAHDEPQTQFWPGPQSTARIMQKRTQDMT